MPIKIGGKDVPESKHEDVLVLPRGDDPIAVQARAIQDFEEFAKLCPDPEPPGKLTKDGFIPNLEDETYKKRLETHNIKRIGWMVVRSVIAMSLADGVFFPIEWDKVKPENPKSWDKWTEDLKDSGFTDIETNLILALVIDVNSLNEQKLKDARESFIRGQEQAAKESSSQASEQESSPSGKMKHFC